MMQTAKKTTLVDLPLSPEAREAGKQTILAILARAAEDTKFHAELAENPTEALRGYYTLTPEEVAALMSGDIKRIEGWVGKLDAKHATWLWSRLAQEKW